MNSLRYDLLSNRFPEGVVTVFQLTTQDRPELADTYDNLGNRLLAQKDTTAAVAAWGQALRIDSNTTFFVDNLRRLGVEPSGYRSFVQGL